MAKITEKEFITFVEKMPAFPKSVHRVIQLAANIDASAKDIVAAVESDPVMTVKILKVINSAFYALPQKITSIQRALVYIGINTIKNLALSVAAIGVLSPTNKAGFNTELFLEHSVATAVLSKRLAERIGISLMQSSDYFVAGLLHDFGKIVFAEYLPNEFKQALEQSKSQKIDLHLAEIEYIGISHTQAGKMLVHKWELAENLAEAIDLHHRSTPSNTLRNCVSAANNIAKQCHLGESGNSIIEPFSAELIDLFGMDLDALIVDLGELSTVQAEVQQFIGA